MKQKTKETLGDVIANVIISLFLLAWGGGIFGLAYIAGHFIVKYW